MKRRIASLVIRLLGWKPEGVRPDTTSSVVVAAPHTTNWDFPLLILFGWYFQVPLYFVAKHTLFRGPLGPAMRAFGGVPVNRSRRDGLVKQLADALAAPGELHIVIPPEASRAARPHWKSGFYNVAKEAQVPIVLSYLDYTRKVGGFGPSFVPSGNLVADMDQVRAFYAGVEGRYPENFGPVRLAEEDL